MIFSVLFSCGKERARSGRSPLPLLVCLLALIASGVAQAQTSTPAYPLSDILSNQGDLGLASVKMTAQYQAQTTPFYKSNGVETRDYDGFFQATSDSTQLAVLSDDGTSVSIDGQSVLDRAGQGQGFEDFSSTFYPLSFSFQAGHIYHLHLRYTNTIHTGDADVDGLTLFAFNGGGTLVTPTPQAQPDLVLERWSDGQSAESVGANIFNDDPQETLGAVVAPSQPQIFHVHIKNTGQDAATFCVKMQVPLVAGAAPQAWAHQGWNARAVVDGQTEDFSSQLQSDSGWTTPSIAANSELVVDLTVSTTAEANTDADGSFRVVAQSGALTDAVEGNLATQGVKSIEYSLDAGATWAPVPAGGVSVPQWSVLGLRGVRSNLNLPWPDDPFKPVWTRGQDTFVGDEVWVQFPTATATGDPGENVQVGCGNTVSLKVQVLPEDE